MEHSIIKQSVHISKTSSIVETHDQVRMLSSCMHACHGVDEIGIYTVIYVTQGIATNSKAISSLNSKAA